MAREAIVKTWVALVAAAAISIAAYSADVVFAPLTLGLFIIALVWPLQAWLTRRTPTLIGLAITMAVAVAVMLAFASLVVWGFSRVGRSLIANSGRYQALYALRSPGSRITACQPRAYGRSISTSAGYCGGRSRSPAASTQRSVSG